MTGKSRKLDDGREERTFLCIPSDKNVKDILSQGQQDEFGGCFKKVGEDVYAEGDVLTIPQKPVSEIFKEIDEKGFATFVAYSPDITFKIVP